MAYYVYIIQSLEDDSFYKGFTENPLQRLLQHNKRWRWDTYKFKSKGKSQKKTVKLRALLRVTLWFTV